MTEDAVQDVLLAIHEKRHTCDPARPFGSCQRLPAEPKPPQAEAIRLLKREGYGVEKASWASGQSVSVIEANVHRGLERLADIVRMAGDAD